MKFLKEYNLTIENCEDEPIHRPDSVQAFGYFVALDPSARSLHAYSENLEKLIPDVGFETDFFAFVKGGNDCREKVLNLHRHAAAANARLPLRLTLTGSPFSTGDAEFQCVLYGSEGRIVLEMEPAHRDPDDSPLNSRFSFHLPNISHLRSIPEQSEHIAAFVRGLTDFDRVMVYRFDEENNGQVIAEAKADGIEPFLGLHYPASDIPAQARRLYKTNWIRIIADVVGARVPVIYKEGATVADQIDMTHSVLRSVSPIHVQYLKNMGVGASLSISLVVEDRLWGLIACHHYGPHYLHQGMRLDLEVAAQAFSFQIAAKEAEIAAAELGRRYERLDALIFRLARGRELRSSLGENGTELLSQMDACGFVYFEGETTVSVGKVPSSQTVLSLLKTFRSWGDAQSKAVTNWKEHTGEDLGAPIAGLLFAPLSRDHTIGTIWFRAERLYRVNWAGKPRGLDESGQADRLSPRGSFALWSQEVAGQCERWSQVDLTVAEKFNRQFVHYVIEKMRLAEATVSKLQELDKAKDQFLASISHELRTPLNAIKGWVEIATSQGATEADRQEAMDVIKRNAHTQSELINDILDYSRIVSGSLKLEISEFSVSDLVSDVCATVSAAAALKNIQMDIRIADASLKMHADQIRIRQILWNLISNALKFTPRGGRIEVSARLGSGMVMLAVADNGTGIPAEHLDSIFERFRQVAQTDTKIGLGLGLSIVKQLVTLHGGEIQVASGGLGLGAKFEVRIPVAPAGTVMTSAQVSSPKKAPMKGSQVLAGLRFLVAEDDPDSRRLLVRLLALHEGASVEAANGHDALDLIEKDSFDLVISDIGMPGLDGYGLIEKIRQHSTQRVASAKVVALTAYSFPKDRARILEAGFDSYVSKPVTVDELLAVIRTLCKV